MNSLGVQVKWDALNRQIIHCRKCPRLVLWRENVAKNKRKAFKDEVYWGKPVPGFGDLYARVMVVGLAPGAHGSNRTGRMFTGDASGEFLYNALYRAGFANQKLSEQPCDGLQLNKIFISALCRCVPPGNKPTKEEIVNCNSFLENEIDLLSGLVGFVALGHLAFESLLKMYAKKYKVASGKDTKFSHGKLIEFGEKIPWIIASYHPSRQNTQTGRLTKKMFDKIWLMVKNNGTYI